MEIEKLKTEIQSDYLVSVIHTDWTEKFELIDH